ncbi:MAG TPA: hypothetical protein VHP38_06415 [Ruminiclostridium sp.]|nr:hypothetical protein [Ruminiclostridium sp.]
MTAEVALLNRNGAVLGSDSFGKVQINNKRKFISVEKIFPLSPNRSVGVMVYNFVHFMGTPWDTIIKVYSSYLGDKSFGTLKEYAEHFLSFFASERRFSAPLVEKLIIQNALDYCIQEIINSVKSTGDNAKNIDIEVEKQLAFFSKEKFLTGFDESFIKNFTEIHSGELEVYINKKPEFKVDAKTQQNLIKLSAYAICKGNFIFKFGSSGLVFAGYGENEIFPSIYGFDVFASIDGKLIYRPSTSSNISFINKQSIYSFGETNVLATYIDGINPDLNDMITGEFKLRLEDLSKKLENKLSNKDLDIFRSFIASEIKEFQNNVFNFQLENCIKPILLMVGMLNKQELATLTESLVSLTLTRQKFSTDEQTAGGEIDVACITKGEGFSWIRNKWSAALI